MCERCRGRRPHPASFSVAAGIPISSAEAVDKFVGGLIHETVNILKTLLIG
jgi:hypothetical protein